MGIVIIGCSGHGKSTLAKAIEQVAGLKCEVLDTNDLIETNKKQIELEVLETETIFLRAEEQRCKNKKAKNWQKTKFYQR